MFANPMSPRSFAPLRALLGAALLAAPTLAGAVTAGGANAVFNTTTGITFPDTYSTVSATATIPKGKSKRVVDISVMAVSPKCDHGAVGIIAGVNGFPIEPFSSIVSPSDQQFLNCGVTGEWWLDLDAAEAAHPGVFIGQPLKIDVEAASATPTPNGFVVLKARMVRK